MGRALRGWEEHDVLTLKPSYRFLSPLAALLLLAPAFPLAPASGGSEPPIAPPTPADWVRAASNGDLLALPTPAGAVHLALQVNEGALPPSTAGRGADLAGIVPIEGRIVEVPGSHLRVTALNGALTGHLFVPARGWLVLSQAPGERLALGQYGASEEDPVGETVTLVYNELERQIGRPPEEVPGWVEEEARLLADLLARKVGEFATEAEETAEWAVGFTEETGAETIDFTLGMVDLLADEAEETSHGCTKLVPGQLASPEGLTDGWVERVLDVAFAVDDAFVARYGPAWSGHAVALVNEMDGILAANVGLRVNVVDLRVLPTGTLTSALSNVVLADLRDYYQQEAAGLARDSTHLLTGIDLQMDLAGVGTESVAGQAECIGSAGNATLAYSVGEVLHDSFQVQSLISTHEMGHLLGGHHHYANCAEPAPGWLNAAQVSPGPGPSPPPTYDPTPITSWRPEEIILVDIMDALLLDVLRYRVVDGLVFEYATKALLIEWFREDFIWADWAIGDSSVNYHQCSLMFNEVAFLGPQVSSINRLVMRGHADGVDL